MLKTFYKVFFANYIPMWGGHQSMTNHWLVIK